MEPQRTPERVKALAWPAGAIALGVATVVVLIVVCGVGIADLVRDSAGAQDWQRLSSVGDAFGVMDSVLSGLAFVALIVTLWIQFHELRLQRKELKLQRLTIERSNSELHRSAEAVMRALHVDLIKMSIDDATLAQVWHDFGDVSFEKYRQYLYANLIFQHLAMATPVVGLEEDQIRGLVRLAFGSPIMREGWRRNAPARLATRRPGDEPALIARIADEVCDEYERSDSDQADGI
jgi:hypothetical protein